MINLLATSGVEQMHLGQILRVVVSRQLTTSRGPARRRLRDGREVVEQAGPPELIDRSEPETWPVSVNSPSLLSLGFEKMNTYLWAVLGNVPYSCLERGDGVHLDGEGNLPPPDFRGRGLVSPL